MSEGRKNIYERISEVMKDIQYLAKDDRVEFGNTKYRAISEEKVTSAVRERLIKHGIVIIPVEQNHKREGTLSTVDTKYRIQSIDDKEDYVIAVSSGTGTDTQDKGVGKAMTYAYKYLLLRTFAIPTGEDPDKISSAELDNKQKLEEETKSAEFFEHQKKVDKLKSALTEKGIDEMEFCAKYKKEELFDLSEKQLEHAFKSLSVS